MSRKNLLVTSIAKKVPLLKAVKAASQRSESVENVYGADLDPECIGRYFVDDFWKMPPLPELNLDELLEYCRQNKIFYIIPTRDGELAFWATYKKVLEENGIKVMVSDLSAINKCLDKLAFFRQGKAFGFPVIPTAETIDGIAHMLYVVKERYGAGSKSLGLNLNWEQAEQHALHLKNPIFQPYIAGQEVSVDLYLDLKGKTKGTVARFRRLVVDGESQITSSFRNEKLETMCAAFAEKLGLYGHIIFQVFIDEENQFHFIECNSRFGGASTLSIAMGLDSFYWFLLETSGIDLDVYLFQRSLVEKTQIRYAEDRII